MEVAEQQDNIANYIEQYGAQHVEAMKAAALQGGFVQQQDRDEAERFLAMLDPTATRFTFQTFDDDAERKAAKACVVDVAYWYSARTGEGRRDCQSHS